MQFLGHKSPCQPPAAAAPILNLLIAKLSGFFSLALGGGQALVFGFFFTEELGKSFPLRFQQDETPTDVKRLGFLV